jgi:5-methylcytosine-specific restriction enzyme A
MPYRISSRCTFPGCPNASTGGPCPTHRAPRPDPRPSAARRGYGRKWEKRRAAKLARDPFCEDCGAPATDVDHVPDRKLLVAAGVADPDAWEYLHSRCKAHHARETFRRARERKAGGMASES